MTAMVPSNSGGDSPVQVAKTIGRDVVVGVLVAAITGIVTFLWAGHHYKQKYEAAINVYTEKLGNQIQAAEKNKDDITVQARTIVSIRNDLRSHLQRLDGLLDSDIDTLDREVKDLQANPTPDRQKAVYDTVRVLNGKWPAKSEQIKVELRKMLAELGFIEE